MLCVHRLLFVVVGVQVVVCAQKKRLNGLRMIIWAAHGQDCISLYIYLLPPPDNNSSLAGISTHFFIVHLTASHISSIAAFKRNVIASRHSLERYIAWCPSRRGREWVHNSTRAVVRGGELPLCH